MHKKQAAICIAAFFWFSMSLWLFFLGARYFTLSTEEFFFKSVVVAVALLIGLLKGIRLLQKRARVLIDHIESQKEPFQFRKAFPKSFLVVIVLMMFLGFSFNFFGIHPLARSGIDFAVATALLAGTWTFCAHLIAPAKSSLNN